MTLGTLIVGCSSQPPIGLTVIEKGDNFKESLSIATPSVPSPLQTPPIRIAQSDSTLIAYTLNTNRLFYEIDLSTWQVVDSFGVSGHGTSELINPWLMLPPDKGIDLIDFGRNCLFEVSGSRVTPMSLPVPESQFEPWLCHYPYVYLSLPMPNGNREIQVYDIVRGEPFDTIHIDGQMFYGSLQHRQHGELGDCYGLGFQNRNEYLLFQRQSDGTVLQTLFKGETPNEKPKRIYYTAMAVKGDTVFLVSQKHVDLSNRRNHGNPVGYTTLELYSIAGDPLVEYNFDFMGDFIFFSPEGDKAYIYSFDDDQFHYVTL